MPSIEGSSKPKSLTDSVEEVLRMHNIQFERSQAEELAKKLNSLGMRNAVKVLDCVLDPECIRFGPEVRVPVERAFEDVFGPGSLVKAQIAEELRRWGLDGLFSVDLVYDVYRGLRSVVEMLRRWRVVRGMYRRTLIRASIAWLVFKVAEVKGVDEGEAERLLKEIGWERALGLVKLVRILRDYLLNSTQTSNSTS